MKPTPTPDVINLVVAAREFWDANNDLSVESLALDKALEPFSSLVPYENEPHDDDFSVEPAKALEWRLNEEGWQIADTFFGGYRVERNPHDHWCWGVFFHGEKGVGLNPADNFEAAKAASQADFNERISSALDAKQAPDFRDMIIIGDTAYPVHSEVCRAFNELSAALSVPAAAVVGETEGWKLVPIEPTPEMIDAGRLARMNIAGGYDGPSSWEAMLAAAPSAPDGWQEAARIGDTVLTWMVKFDLLDADNEYRAEDVVAVLNDLSPSDASAEVEQLRVENAKFRKALTKIAERADDNLPRPAPWSTPPRKPLEAQAMTDLVERLHDDVRQLTKMVEHAKLAGPETGVRVKDPSLLLADLSEAATRISQQDAELERVRREVEEAKAEHQFSLGLVDQAAVKLTKAREALRDICTAIEREPLVGDLDYPHAHNDWRGWRKKVLRPAAEKARALLGGE